MRAVRAWLKRHPRLALMVVPLLITSGLTAGSVAVAGQASADVFYDYGGGSLDVDDAYIGSGDTKYDFAHWNFGKVGYRTCHAVQRDASWDTTTWLTINTLCSTGGGSALAFFSKTYDPPCGDGDDGQVAIRVKGTSGGPVYLEFRLNPVDC